MSCQTDRSFAGVVVDSLEFARQSRRLAGGVTVAELGRLADVLVDDGGKLACELLGMRDAEGNPCLRLKVDGGLNLRCQRCLAAMRFEVHIDSTLRLVAPGEEWPDDELAEDGPDAIEASRELAVLPLVEDEVLLALPIAPRHEECRPPMAVEGNEHRPSPFAALAKLKDH